MQSATVQRPSVPWWIVLLIGIGLTIAAIEGYKALFPYVLEELVTRPHFYVERGRYPSKDICHKAGHRLQEKRRRDGEKVMPFRCRYDGP